MGRAPCCSKEGVQRGPWSTKEDMLLTTYIQSHGEGQWKSLPKRAGLLRCGKSCRLRWLNYLRPGIKRGNITPEEEDLIIRLQSLLGNRWSLIAGRLPGRTDNEIKNHWNTHILKRLKEQGIKPKSHKHNSKPTRSAERKLKSNHNDSSDNNPEEKEEKLDELVTVDKVLYHPKPTRLSARFTVKSSNSSSDDISAGSTDSLGSDDSSSQRLQWEVDDQESETNILSDDIPWTSFDLGDDANYLLLHDQSTNHLCNYEDENLLFECDFSLQDDTLLNKVYDEYLQLLYLDRD